MSRLSYTKHFKSSWNGESSTQEPALPGVSDLLGFIQDKGELSRIQSGKVTNIISLPRELMIYASGLLEDCREHTG